MHVGKLHTRNSGANGSCPRETDRDNLRAAWQGFLALRHREKAMSEVPVDSMTKHHGAVRRFVGRLVRDQALAEDLTQETFLRVQRSPSGYRGEANERSWLCAVALNLVRDHFRSAARVPAAAPDPAVLDQLPSHDDTEQTMLQEEMSACIAEFLLQLPRPQYDVVALHDTAGLSHGEIAVTLGISPANSRVLLHRGRAALREILKQNCILSLGDDAIPCERRPSKGEPSGCPQKTD